MNNQINFTPARDTLKTILGNGKYYFVPKFQRNYSWEKEQWEDLWFDIMDLWTVQSQHYMGNMVLRSLSNEQFEIIDGQQRITTLSLLIQANVEYLRKNNLPILADIINKEFLVRRLPRKEEYDSVKLNLNETNNNFYVRLNTSKDIISERAENESNRLMYKAYKYFYEKLAIEFEDKNPLEIDNFLNYFASNLIFIHITSDTDEKVYSIFETLNSRGLSLTSTDLIKNYILGIISDEKTKIYWDNIATVLDTQLFDFIKHYMTITIGGGKIIREKNTFKVFKNNYKSSKQVLDFLIDANKYINFYSALSNYTSEFWLDFDNYNDLIKNIEELKMFKATQYKSIALSVFIFHFLVKTPTFRWDIPLTKCLIKI